MEPSLPRGQTHARHQALDCRQPMQPSPRLQRAFAAPLGHPGDQEHTGAQPCKPSPFQNKNSPRVAWLPWLSWQSMAAWLATTMDSRSSRQSISSTTCGGTGTQPAAHSRMPAQQAYWQPGLTGSSCLSSCGRGSAFYISVSLSILYIQHASGSLTQTAGYPGTTLASRLPSQPPAAPALGAQHGGYRSRFWMTRPSAQTWLQ